MIIKIVILVYLNGDVSSGIDDDDEGRTCTKKK